jgi:hypothetical protein
MWQRAGFADGVAGPCPDGLSQPSHKLILRYPAGGTTDFLGRLVADQIKSGLGATVIVENKPRAATALIDRVRGAANQVRENRDRPGSFNRGRDQQKWFRFCRTNVPFVPRSRSKLEEPMIFSPNRTHLDGSCARLRSRRSIPSRTPADAVRSDP